MNSENIYDQVSVTNEQTLFDDGDAGEFVIVSQHDHSKVVENKIKIDPSEWPMLRKAIDQMIKECRTT